MTKYNNDDARRVEAKPSIAPRAFGDGFPFLRILEKAVQVSTIAGPIIKGNL